MTVLISLINIAEKDKPSMGSPCNNCGWCCLTEVCSIGKELGSEAIPCKFLVQKDQNNEKHYCSLALNFPDNYMEPLAINTGCDAKTQNEILRELVK
jgi:uncharacterized cysteine cluster protein YcgN (CxxCxxCC family)